MRILLFSEVTLFKYNVSTILSPIVACEYSRFSLLLATKDVSPGEKSPWRNFPGGEELGETAIFAGYSFSGSMSSWKGMENDLNEIASSPEIVNWEVKLVVET